MPATVIGGIGRDEITTGNRADRVDGGLDQDRVKGGAGNDVLDAGEDPPLINLIGGSEVIEIRHRRRGSRPGVSRLTTSY